VKKSRQLSKKEVLDSKRFAKIIDLSKGGKGDGGYENKKVSLWKINILPQPRKTFDGIAEMADNIAGESLINPLTVAYFNAHACRQYLDILNRLWNTNFLIYDLQSVSENGKKFYYILLGGERRTRGMKLIWSRGCETCRSIHGEEKEGVCFRRHFKGDKVDVRYRPKTNPLEALFVQFAENIHKRVPSHEEAQAYDNYFRFLRQLDPSFPLAVFARKVGRSVETIRNALRFCELPAEIQDIVRQYKGKYYSLAVETSRLYRAGMEPELVRIWLLRGIVEQQKSAEFQKSVTQYLENLSSGQLSLLDIFSEKREKEFQKSQIRRVVAANTIMAVHTWIGYLERIEQLFEAGQLKKKDSPFSHKSPVKVYAKFLQLMKDLSVHFKELGPIKFRDASEEIGDVQALVEMILKKKK
jgi:hypothetical protein